MRTVGWLLLGVGGCGTPVDPDVDHGVEVPARAPDETIQANLAIGADMSSVQWAHDAFCWSAGGDDAFSGFHVLFVRQQPADTDVWLRAKPAADVDVSLYYVQAAPEVTAVPPELTAADIFSCDAMFLASGNAGQGETLLAAGASALPLIIGVAGAADAEVGSFTLEIWGLPAE